MKQKINSEKKNSEKIKNADAKKTQAKKFKRQIEIKSFGDYKLKEYLIAVLLFFITAIVPLIVRYINVPVGPEELAYIRNETMNRDFFSYYKSMFVVIASVVMLVFHILYYFSYPNKFSYKRALRNPAVIAAFVYIAAVLLSAVFSKFPYIALNGITERYESVFVLLSYMVIFFTVIDFANSRFQYKVVLAGLFFSAAVIGLIGIFQFFNKDIFNTALLSKLVLGKAINELKGIKGSFTTVYATLYNPNAAGMYTALMFPVALFTGLFYKDNIIVKIILLIISALLLVSLIGTTSVGGFASLATVTIVTLITGVVYLIKSGRGFSAATAAIFSVAIVTLVCSALFIKPINKGIMVVVDRMKNIYKTGTHYFYKDIYIEGDTVYITVSNGSIALTLDHEINAMTVTKDGTVIQPSSEEASDEGLLKHSYNVEGFGSFDIIFNEEVAAFQMAGSGYMFYLKSNPGELLMISKTMMFVDITQEVPYVGFEGAELFGSSRGYIWSRSIPLLKDNILLGSGPDAYALCFPQNDIIGKTRYTGDPYMVVDKPHNFYLQTAINTGAVSLLALLVICGYFLIKMFISIVNTKKENENAEASSDSFLFGLKLGVMTGVCGYLTAAMATDSVVSVAPVFWVVMGLGMALLAKKNKNGSEL